MFDNSDPRLWAAGGHTEQIGNYTGEEPLQPGAVLQVTVDSDQQTWEVTGVDQDAGVVHLIRAR